MKKYLLATMVAIGLASVAACNRDTTSPNRANPPDRAAPRAQNTSPASGAPGTSSGAAGASNTSPRPDQGTQSQVAQLSFESADINKDGVITLNEALAVPGLDFASADKDKSHTLSRQEFEAAMAKARPAG